MQYLNIRSILYVAEGTHVSTIRSPGSIVVHMYYNKMLTVVA